MQRFRELDGAWPGKGVMAKATGEAARNWKVVRDSLQSLDHQQEEATLETLESLEGSVVAYTTARDYWAKESAMALFDTPLYQRVDVKLNALQLERAVLDVTKACDERTVESDTYSKLNKVIDASCACTSFSIQSDQ